MFSKRLMEEDREESIYNEEGMQEAIDADEIDEFEQGFMQGYENEEKSAKCSLCNKILDNKEEDIIEVEFEGEIYRFCSEKCAETFKKEQEI